MKNSSQKSVSKNPIKTDEVKPEQQLSTRLNTLSKKAIQEAFDFQRKNAGWDFYSERAFLENLFNQRFNYLIVMYSLFITAAATVNTRDNLIIVLFLGSVITFLVSLTVYRAYVKLIILLKILYSLENHVFQAIDQEVKSMGKKALFRVNQITGVIIPSLCFFTLLFGLICAIFGWLKPL